MGGVRSPEINFPNPTTEAQRGRLGERNRAPAKRCQQAEKFNALKEAPAFRFLLLILSILSLC
jgi:hypothetical protein